MLLAASLALTAYCQNLWQLALVYGVLASLGLAGTGPVVANAVVTRWFVRRRGTAVSLLGSAAMTGMSLLVPGGGVAHRRGGLADCLRGARARSVLVGMVPMCLFVVRDSPESMGLRPDGDPFARGARAPVIDAHARRRPRCARWPSGSSPARSSRAASR